MEIPARSAQRTQLICHVDQPLGNHVAHFAAALLVTLPYAVHGQQARAINLLAKALSDGFPHDHVDATSLVFEGDEDHTLGGLGTLAHGDQAAGAHQATMRHVGHLCSGEQSLFHQFRAHQRQRVTAQR